MTATDISEERKVVTVLFCDLVGFTAASEQADPEDIRARLQTYYSTVRAELDRFGGTVEKFIGDAVMAVFGAPLAHEDDPERAVRAGLQILDALDDLDATDPGLDLSVRIGINTGEAIVNLGAKPERGEAMVAGGVVNTASRLQTIAPVGGVAVGEGTYRATLRQFEYQKLRPIKVKGKVDPLPLWRAVSVRPHVQRDLSTTYATPLIGREAELAALHRALDRAAQSQSMQFVTIVGEPGAGKSRLVAELGSFLKTLPGPPVTWRQGRCLPYGDGVTFWALIEIVKAEVGILDSDPLETARAKLEAVTSGTGPDRAWLRQRLLALLGLEATSATDQDEAFAAWRAFLESMARTGPAVVVVEDLHWADEAMLSFVQDLVKRPIRVPMLLVATARPEIHERQPARAAGTGHAATITLSDLSDTETLRLVSLLLDATDLPEALQTLIVEGADGNPLYAEEYVRLLNDRGLVIRRGPALELAAGAVVPAPAAIQALIAARLDTLPSALKRMLQDASVIGKVFWSGALAQMGNRDPNEIAIGLDELSGLELVRPASISTMAGEAEYSFWHMLIRDVAYSQLPRAAKAEKHRRAAVWIETQAPDRLADVTEFLAHHYTAALDLVRAGRHAEEANELAVPARKFLALAGERALGIDPRKAESSFSRALDLTSIDDRERAPILTLWARAIQQGGRHAEAANALEQAVVAFREQGEVVKQARAMSALASVLFMTGSGRVRELATEAVALLESEPPGSDLVTAYGDMAAAAALSGEYGEAIRWADRALELAKELGTDVPVRALGFRGNARSQLGERAGLNDLRLALALALERGQAREAASLYNNLAATVTPIEGPAAALAVVTEGIAFAERRGLTEDSLYMAAGTLDVLFDLGRWDDALAGARRLEAQLEATGSILPLAVIRVQTARILVLRGASDEALRVAEWGLKAARDSGGIDLIVVASSTAAVARLNGGDRGGAVKLLTEVEWTPHVREATGAYSAALPAMVRTAVAAGDRRLGERLANGVDPVFPYHEHAVRAARPVLSEARPATKEAAWLYAAAAKGWRELGVVPELAFAIMGQGRALLNQGNASEAAAVLHQARQIFADLNAGGMRAEADSLLQRARRERSLYSSSRSQPRPVHPGRAPSGKPPRPRARKGVRGP